MSIFEEYGAVNYLFRLNSSYVFEIVSRPWYTLRGGSSHFLSFLKRVLLYKERICSKRNHFRVNPFSEGVWYAGNQRQRHKSCLLIRNDGKFFKCINICAVWSLFPYRLAGYCRPSLRTETVLIILYKRTRWSLLPLFTRAYAPWFHVSYRTFPLISTELLIYLCCQLSMCGLFCDPETSHIWDSVH